MDVRVYGTKRGTGSWARVTSGLIRGLQANGALAGFFEIGSVDDFNPTTVQGDSCGYDAPMGVAVGPHTVSAVMKGHGAHQARLMVVATNSTWLPRFYPEMTEVTGYAATSEWASGVVSAHVGPRFPVLVWHHGVDPGFAPGPSEPSSEYSVLHLASTHLERKGTTELIHGWCRAVKDGPVRGRLDLLVDGPRGYFNRAIHEASGGDPDVVETMRILPRKGLSVDEMAALLSSYDVVCQPSRAEGFGLVPLEARACGVPVIATLCTGHADHMAPTHPGVVPVRHGDLGPVNDGPGAMAPTVDADDVAEALVTAFLGRDDLKSQAMASAAALRDLWSWERVAERFLTAHRQTLLGTDAPD